MPELIEVQLQVEALQDTLRGRVLRALELLDPRLAPAGLPDLSGQVLIDARRRGKHLLLDFPSATLILHLRMSGQLLPQNLSRPARMRLRLEQGGMDLIDPRRLATLEAVAPGDEARHLPPLGDEPWPERRAGPWWAQRLSAHHAPLKVALMDQRAVAGLGNIAAAEICFRAALSPHRRCASLSAPMWERLADGAWDFLSALIAEERARGLRYVSAGGLAPKAFLVYQRGESPCVRCGHPLLREVQAGRSTCWCPECQR